MRNLKRFAVLMLSLVLSLTCLTGCDTDGDAFSLSAAVGEAPRTLDPIYAQRVSEQTVIAHLYENLMKRSVDAEGNVTSVYGMAKSVDQETNVDGSVTYTFRLRSAKWSDGKAVKADDFVYAWQRLADPMYDSPYAELMQVVCGYDEARASGDMSLLQVSAKNDTTLVVNLTGSYDWFLNEVCTAPATVPLRRDKVPALVKGTEEAVEVAAAEEEWWTDAESLVGNGPYLVSQYHAGASVTLTANEEHYNHGKQNNPAQITLYFADAAEGAALYESGDVDVLWPVTDEAYTARLAEEDFEPIPTLSTYTLLFNTAAYPFWDQTIAQAVVKALDREALAAAAGVTAQAAEALVPYGVPDGAEKDFRTCAGPLVDTAPELYAQNCVEAMELLQGAGYESGADFGELQYLYVDEGSAAAVAEELCRQLRSVLNMEITPCAVTEEELAAAFEEKAFTMAAKNVTALCNDAECFLLDWVSTSPNNVVSYTNSAYDTLMSIIAGAPDGTARLGCLHDAEELLISDAALTPLYTTCTTWEVRETLQGALRDARGWFSFAGVTQRQS